MIQVEDVHKRFGDFPALAGVSFTVADGRATALLGPNGAGKTTLMRTLVGLLKRDRGSVSIDGVDPDADPMAARRNIGLLTDHSEIETHFVGKDFYSNKTEDAHLHFYDSFETFSTVFQNRKPIEKLILIKGSRGMALERTLDLL